MCKGKKGNKVEIEIRRNDVYELLLAGNSKSTIVAHCYDKYNVRLSTVEKDITFARAELKKFFQVERDDVIGMHLARYEEMFRLYSIKGEMVDSFNEDGEVIKEFSFNPSYNLNEAAKMLERKEKLMKLHNAEIVVNNTHNSFNTKSLDNDELHLLKELLTKND